MTKRKIIQLISVTIISILIVSSCDIIDEAFGKGQGNVEESSKTIDRVEVEFLIDNANAVLTYYNPPANTPAVDNLTGVEFGADITSISGSSVYIDENNKYITSFDNPESLGQTIRGAMEVIFFEDPKKINININQVRSYNSLIFGHVDQTYSLKYDGITYNQNYTDSFTDLEVNEYYISGSAINNADAYFTEDNSLYYNVTNTTVCSNRAFIKVKVHYK